MTSLVRKAILPAAGNATRFLPATKAQPKAMLPLLDKPAIQYVVEEAVAAGITDILVVTGRGTRGVADHFDRAPELERELTAKGKLDELALITDVTELARLHFVRQGEAKGLGHAVSLGRAFVGDEPFAVLLPDDLMIDRAALLRSMIEAFDTHGGSVVAFQEMPLEEVVAYGVAAVDPTPVADGLLRLRGVVEKPTIDEAPSRFGSTGRYVFSPAIFDCIDQTKPGRNGEIQLTDAIAMLLEDEPVFAKVFDSGRHDVGTPLDFLRTSVVLAADRPDLGPPFLEFLSRFARERGLLG
jgi:UTP--glucose-1-phosphate uridylyltransferase